MRDLPFDTYGRFEELQHFDPAEAPTEMNARPVPPLAAYEAEYDPAADRVAPGAFKRASALEGKPVPPREWLVEGLIPLGTVTLLGGDGGTGKSLLSLQLATAVAQGRKWIGRSVTQGGAVFLSAEDDDAELERRIADIARAEGLARADLGKLTYRSLAGENALLAMLDSKTGKLRETALYNELSRFLADEKPALVVLDTLADLFPGNENDRAQARQFIGLLRGLAIKHQCAVLLLAHPSLSGLNSGTGTSGSTGWSNSVRSRLYLERVTQDGHEANPDARVLKSMKANYGPTGDEIGLTWQTGVFVADVAESGLDRMAKGAKAERVFLKLLALFNGQGRTVCATSGRSFAPAIFASHPEAEGVNKRALTEVMELLLASGRVVNIEEGPASKRRNHLAMGVSQ